MTFAMSAYVSRLRAILHWHRKLAMLQKQQGKFRVAEKLSGICLTMTMRISEVLSDIEGSQKLTFWGISDIGLVRRGDCGLGESR